MRKLLFVFVLGAFAACGGNGGAEAVGDSLAVTPDTISAGTMITDTTGASMMQADTSGMSNAR